MKLYEVQERTAQLLTELLNIWESSVRATHHFLSDAEVKKIKEYVPQAFNQVAHLIIAENELERAVAFMGTENHRLEMLFVSPLGKRKRNRKAGIAIWNSTLWNSGSYGQ